MYKCDCFAIPEWTEIIAMYTIFNFPNLTVLVNFGIVSRMRFHPPPQITRIFYFLDFLMNETETKHK